MTAPPRGPERVRASYIDPYGRLERDGGRFVRHVRAEAAAWLKPLHDSGTLARWSEGAHLIPTQALGFAAGEGGDWLLAHPAIEPLSLAGEWCGSMLRDAALATLDLLLALEPHGFTLQDAHPHNIVFDGARPVFVDLTSIVPQSPGRIWNGYGQFLDFFRNPLLLCADGKGAVARALLLNTVRGAPLEEVYPLLSVRARLARPGLALSYRLARGLQRHAGLRRRLKAAALHKASAVEAATRRRFLAHLRRSVAGLHPRQRGLDSWSGYYDDGLASGTSAAKVETIEKILAAEKPRTLTDIGCNTGFFSLMAARAGARVLALDGSEPCIERLYAEAKASALALTPIVADILAPTPGHGFMAREYPALPERAASEVVLCLALVHHLLTQGRQTEERVAELVGDLASRLAIVELVEPDDANLALIASLRPVAYRTDRLKDALGARFRSVEILPSDRPTRTLALCRK